MATIKWTGKAGDHNWTTPKNWDGTVVPGQSDTVIFDHSTATGAYSVYVTSAIKAASVTIGDSVSTVSIGLLLQTSASSLTTTGAINFAQSTSVLQGVGSINAEGGFKLSGAATTAKIIVGQGSSGGTLDVTGVIASNIMVGFANITYASTLKLESASTLNNSVAIKSATQTLEIGAAANVTITSAENITNGTIKLDGGTLSVTSAYGLTVGAGANLIGTGAVAASILGSGTITASGGTLTVSGPISYSGAASSLVIGSGSSLLLTTGPVSGSSSGVGSASVAPTLTFQGTGDLFQAVNAGMSNFYLGAISGFAGTDLMQFASFGAGDTISYNAGDSSITISDAANDQKTFTFDSSDTAAAVFASSDTVTADGDMVNQTTIGGVTADVLSICFLAGTLIATPAGEVPIETLRRGDLVLTSEGAAKPVSWLGKQTISRRFADPIRSWPIRILADALADNAPTRDLLVSPDHALLVDGVLVHAGALVNDRSILRETNVPASFIYYHVELDDHSLILAENVPAETFIDNVDRLHFDNWAEHEALYPQGKPIVEMPYPRAKAWRQVPVAVRDRLAERARLIGEQAVA